MEASFEPSNPNATLMYSQTIDALKYSLDRSEISFPSLSEYSTSRFIFSADLTPDHSSGAAWRSKTEQGAISCEIRFSRPTSTEIVAIAIAETNQTLKIDEDSSITIE